MTKIIVKGWWFEQYPSWKKHSLGIRASKDEIEYYNRKQRIDINKKMYDYKKKKRPRKYKVGDFF